MIIANQVATIFNMSVSHLHGNCGENTGETQKNHENMRERKKVYPVEKKITHSAVTRAVDRKHYF